jgi:hypothetical protein
MLGSIHIPKVPDSWEEAVKMSLSTWLSCRTALSLPCCGWAPAQGVGEQCLGVVGGVLACRLIPAHPSLPVWGVCAANAQMFQPQAQVAK